MTDHDRTYSRRRFIQQGLTFASLATTTPWFIERSARAMAPPDGSVLGSRPGVPDDHVLVIVQLGGGNDGLNTVIPYGAGQYYNVRPSLAVPAPGSRGNNPAIDLDPAAGIGLHPGMAKFKTLIDDGVGSIIQGVGYPNPNRSHFASMDVWHTADADGKGEGWIGRYFDNACNGTPIDEGSVAIGRTAPLAMVGKIQKPITFESQDLFRWMGTDLHESLEDPYHTITRRGELQGVEPGSQLSFLLRTTLDAQVSSDRIRSAVAKKPLVSYPGSNLASQLQLVGAMIRAGMRTRVYYVALGGFDTHANQAGRHANLLRQFSDAMHAFYQDLKAQGNAGRVLTMAFSEFGRRVAQNASGGTDHGTAAPMYLMGDMVRPGLLGSHPSLTDLDQGDLRFTADFRCVYAAILEKWMRADAIQVLGERYRVATVLNA